MAPAPLGGVTAEPGAPAAPGAPAPAETFLSQVGRNPGKLRIALMLRPITGSPVDPQCLEAARNAGEAPGLFVRWPLLTPQLDDWIRAVLP